MNPCKICSKKSSFKVHTFREIMYGFDEEFKYFECPYCNSLQIKNAPENISRYYGNNYNSFQNIPKLKDNRIKAFLKKERTNACIENKNIFRTILTSIYKPPEYFEWFKRVNLNHQSSILDIGCGAGHLLIRMKKDGFSQLKGTDLFIPDDILYENGVKVYKKELTELDEKFDFIMMHHSFEHMLNPIQTFKNIYKLLKKDRFLLLRIPVFGNFAWREYGPNWVQIDAPRHFYSYSKKSIEYLAELAGFRIADVVYDSTEFQFWGSEQCLKGISLSDENSFGINPDNSIFSSRKIKAFKKKAVELNENNDGDQACFYLYKE